MCSSDLGLRNSFTEIADFVVVDRDGNRLYTTAPQKAQRVNVSSEKYFAQLRDSARDGIVISEVIVSRSSGKLIVVVARPARDGQGAFQGAALATLKIDEFENLFRTLDIAAGGNVALYRSDDFSRVVRWPPADGKLNQVLPPDRDRKSTRLNSSH